MADIYTVPELTWTTTNITVPNLNTYNRDNMQALRAGLTDSSADPDMIQAVKTGTLAARSGVTHFAGRMYRTTDTQETFVSDGTSWRHNGGSGAYDDFFRADNTNLNTNNLYQPTGSPWTEESGDWQIVGNALGLVGAADGMASLQTSALLNRSYRMKLSFTTQATQGLINLSAGVKFASTTNAIYVELTATAFRILSRIGGVDTVRATSVTAPTANTPYRMDIDVNGNQVEAVLSSPATQIVLGTRHADVLHANLAAATKVSIRTNDTLERFANIAVYF